MEHCKIKYKGSIRSNTVIVDTMETARQSGPGYVKQLLLFFGCTDEPPYPEIEIEFSLKQGIDAVSRINMGRESIRLFQWKIVPNTAEWGFGCEDEWPWLLVVHHDDKVYYRGLIIKETWDKIIIKEIIEVLI